MSKRNNQRIIEFMDWIRETYQCPEHPDHVMEISPDFPTEHPKASNFSCGYILSCTATLQYGAKIKNPVEGRCFFHIHVDDLRKLSQTVPGANESDVKE